MGAYRFLIFALFTAMSAEAQILKEYNFSDDSSSPGFVYGCTSTIESGLLKVEVSKSSSNHYMVFPAVSLTTPLKVRLRLRADTTFFAQGDIYWLTAQDPEWSMQQFRRFPFIYDGEWHEYEIPLPTLGQFIHLRLSIGMGYGKFEIDWIRIENNPIPPIHIQNHNNLPAEFSLSDDRLQVTLKTAEHLYTIVDKSTSHQWRLNGKNAKALLVTGKKIDDKTLQLGLYDPSQINSFTTTVQLRPGGIVHFEITGNPSFRFFGLNNYPPTIEGDLSDGRLLFCDRASGNLIRQDDPFYSNRLLTVYGNTSCTDMPWVGVVDQSSGEGVMALVETPADAFFHLRKDSNGHCWPQIQWDESLMTMRYPRTFSYRFSAEGGYVALAKMYREYVRETGRLKTLDQKQVANPVVSLVKGAPVLWGGSDVWRFVQEARVEGLTKGILSNAHHGLRNLDSLRKLNQMGFITNEYDNITDIHEGPTGMGRDSIEETALHAHPGGGPAGGWVDEVNNMTIRSSAFALRALKTYVPPALERYGFNGRFIDVNMAMHLFEDYHPQHTFDRRQDLQNRREVMEWIHNQGLVQGTEHGNDWGVDLVEYTEGALSGPNWWSQADPNGWYPGWLLRALSRNEYKPEYLKYGIGYDTRIPLWQLVYHDCVFSTPYWGDSAGFHFQAAPDISDRIDLFTLLYGGTPLFWRDHHCFDWYRNRNRFMQSYLDTCPVFEELAFSEMLSHEFLNADSTLQRTRFSSGHSVIVNFASDPQAYETANGDSVNLAPGGFYVEGPELIHQRIIKDDQVITVTQKKNLHRYDLPSQQEYGPVEGKGRFVIFHVDDNRWQLAVDGGQSVTINPVKITGWPDQAEYALLELDNLGVIRRFVENRKVHEPLRIAIPDTGRHFYAFQKYPVVEPLFAYPNDTYISSGTPVILTSSIPGTQIHYTLDGSEPTLQSPIYENPFYLDRSATLKMQGFVSETEVIQNPKENQSSNLAIEGTGTFHPVGNVLTRNYIVYDTLYTSRLIRGGEAARFIDLPLSGYCSIRIVITSGGDEVWNDWVVLGNAKFIRTESEPDLLNNRTPQFFDQSVDGGGIYRNLHPRDGGPLNIAGENYPNSFGFRSEGEAVIPVLEEDTRFQAYVGIDDRGYVGPTRNTSLWGSAEVVIQGIK